MELLVEVHNLSACCAVSHSSVQSVALAGFKIKIHCCMTLGEAGPLVNALLGHG